MESPEERIKRLQQAVHSSRLGAIGGGGSAFRKNVNELNAAKAQLAKLSPPKAAPPVNTTAGMGAKLQAAQSIIGGGSSGGEQTTSTGAGALGGAVSGASAGAAFGPVGAVVGGAVGALTGGLKARRARKIAQAEAHASAREKEGEIEGTKAERVNAAMRSMAAGMGSTLNSVG